MKTELGRLIENYVDAKIDQAREIERSFESGDGSKVRHATHTMWAASDELDEWINKHIDKNEVSLTFLYPRD